MNRRAALKTLVATGAALPWLNPRSVAGETKIVAPAGQRSFTLGVASVSLKSLPLDNALAAIRRVGLGTVSLHRAHSPWDGSTEAWQAVADKIRAAGVEPRCCGVLYLKNDEAMVRRMLDYVRVLGVKLFSCSIEPAGLPLLARLVQEYDLRAAIHNHGPEDKVWPTAAGVWTAIQPYDARIGLCLDVGHGYRAGEDVVALLQRCRSRLYDVHLKDTMAAVGAEDIPVELGRGRINLQAILAGLIELGYSEHVWFEYEKDPNDPVPGLAESVGYIRGLLKGLSVV